MSPLSSSHKPSSTLADPGSPTVCPLLGFINHAFAKRTKSLEVILTLVLIGSSITLLTPCDIFQKSMISDTLLHRASLCSGFALICNESKFVVM